jgi:hypothetical protein
MLDIVCFVSVLALGVPDMGLSKNIKAGDLLILALQMGTTRTHFTKSGELIHWRTLGLLTSKDGVYTDWFPARDTGTQAKDDDSFGSG